MFVSRSRHTLHLLTLLLSLLFPCAVPAEGPPSLGPEHSAPEQVFGAGNFSVFGDQPTEIASATADNETVSQSGSESDSDRISALEAQVAELRASIKTTKEDDKAKAAAAKPEKPRFPNIRVNGMLHFDGGWIDQDADNEALLGDIDNSVGFRRARIGTEGYLTEEIYYRFIADFGLLGRPSFRDAWVEYRDLPNLGTIRLGEFRQPFGMDCQTPAREQLFIERSSVNALSPFRQYGIGLHNTNEDKTIAWFTSFFGYNTDVWGNAIGDDGLGVAARVHALPFISEDETQLIHIGADYGYLHPVRNGLRYRSTAEYSGLLTGSNGNTNVVPPFIDTGFMDAAHSNLFGLELATMNGPFSFQSELTCAVVDLETGDTSTFTGYYAQAGYVLTGESLGYNRDFGNFERIQPDCPVGSGGMGAWQLMIRASHLDLESGTISGGRLTDVTLGVNWFLNNNTRWQVNYIRAIGDRDPVGNNYANIITTRVAFDF